MAGEYIFTMRDLRKVVPPSREILKGILSLLLSRRQDRRAGRERRGEILPAPNHGRGGQGLPGRGSARCRGPRSATCRRSRSWIRAKDVRGNVMEGVSEQQQMLDQFNEISARFAEPMDDEEMTRLLEKQGNLQERIDALGLWELDHKIDMAMDALRLPPGDADV